MVHVQHVQCHFIPSLRLLCTNHPRCKKLSIAPEVASSVSKVLISTWLPAADRLCCSPSTHHMSFPSMSTNKHTKPSFDVGNWILKAVPIWCPGTQKKSWEWNVCTKLTYNQPMILMSPVKSPRTKDRKCECKWLPNSIVTTLSSATPPVSDLRPNHVKIPRPKSYFLQVGSTGIMSQNRNNHSTSQQHSNTPHIENVQ